MKDFNIRATQQVSDFLYNFLQLKPVKKTAGGNNSTDESVIIHHAEKDNIIFCKKLLQNRKLEKGIGTYIADIKRNLTEDDFLHPDLWLNTTETFRSSASSPNIQNQPVHGFIIEVKGNKKKSIPWDIIRKVYIRIQAEEVSKKLGKNWLLLEGDYEGAEVKTAANLSEDKQLIDDLNNKLDMHSHWTNVIFGWNYDLPHIKKNFENERYLVKNTWTFANFYGAGPESIAEEFRKFDVYKKFVMDKYSGKKGKAFDAWFKDFSIDHIAKCQQSFYERYEGFKTWQEFIVQFYYENHYIETPLGFRRNHPLKRNEVLNFPIQATSFHILLDGCIRIQKKLLSMGFRSKLATQIHDSVIVHVYLPEIYELMDMLDHELINHKLPIPKKASLNTEWKIGKNWQTMKKLPMIDRN